MNAKKCKQLRTVARRIDARPAQLIRMRIKSMRYGMEYTRSEIRNDPNTFRGVYRALKKNITKTQRYA